jgi:hypothetical protein
MKGQIYNVGLSDANVSKKELCQHIQKFVSDFVFLHEQVGRDPDQRNYVVSNEKIEKNGLQTNLFARLGHIPVLVCIRDYDRSDVGGLYRPPHILGPSRTFCVLTLERLVSSIHH